MKAQLLKKFFAGECSDVEVQEIIRWINSQEAAESLSQEFDQFEHDEISEADDALFASVRRRLVEEELMKELQASETTAMHLLHGGRRSRMRKYFPLVAASFVLLMSAFAIYLYHHQKKPVVHAAAEAGIVNKVTEAGQKLTLRLADGSLAILNSNSTLSYPSRFTDTERSVAMSGEVYFEVAKDEHRPFIVSTSSMKVQVLGTSFNIHATNDLDQEVSLLTGALEVQMQGDSWLLQPGEAVWYADGEVGTRAFDTATRVLWKDGIIHLEEASLSESFRILESWYGVSIAVIGEDLSDGKRVSGTFDNDYLTNVLNSLSYAQNFDYEVDGDRVSIRFRP